MSETNAARACRIRIAVRHDKAARDGIHLPSPTELLLGMSWFAGDICADAAAYAERVLPRIDVERPCGARLRETLAPLTASPRPLDFAEAAEAAQEAADSIRHGYSGPRYRGPDIEHVAERLDYYAASTGDGAACLRVAARAGRLASNGTPSGDMAADFAQAALGWLAAAAYSGGSAKRIWERSVPFTDARTRAGSEGASLVGAIIKRHQSGRAAASETTPPPAGRRGLPMAAMAGAAWDPDCDLREGVRQPWEADPEPEDEPPGVVVLSEIGSADTAEGKKIRAAFAPVIGKRLRYEVARRVGEVRDSLVGEWPHAVNAIDSMLRGLEDNGPVRIRPTVLVGEPGCGKTTLAQRMLALLGIPAEVYPCSASSDNSLAGTARRWTTGEASLPASLVSRHRIANPAIILDEVDKAAFGGSGGSLRDALLGLLEPSSSRCWHDPFLQAGVDLSAVIWIATANNSDVIPAVLRDRLRVLRVPTPGKEHLPVLATTLLRQEVERRGLVNAWADDLAAYELEGLAEHWRGGSIRKLGRLVEGVIAARERGYARA